MGRSCVVFCLVTLASASAFAGKTAFRVYQSLDVEPASVEQTQDFEVFKKAVGGLSCWKKDFDAILSASQFDCAFHLDGRDDKAIYLALKGQEVNVTPEGNVEEATFEKQVANVVCQKTYPIVAQPTYSYSCQIK